MKIVRSVSGINIGGVVQTMRMRAFRPIVALLSIVLLASTPVHAGPVVISEVIQTIANHQNPSGLRLRSFKVTADTSSSGMFATVVADSRLESAVDGSSETSDELLYSDSLLSGVAISTQTPLTSIDTITQGDIQGTICDCGEITVPGGFPKWPLLFLAAIPLIFIDTSDDTSDDTEVPLATPTPTPTPAVVVPEPASLLLFGSGLLALGASFRRRYGKQKLVSQADTTEEG